MNPEQFEYAEIRPVDKDLQALTLSDLETPEQAENDPRVSCYTLYGRKDGLAVAIGDFNTFEAAWEALRGFTVPMIAARDALDSVLDKTPEQLAALVTLEDFLNQSTNEERF